MVQHNGTTKSTRIQATPFILGSLVCFACVFAIYWLFVRTATGQFVDESALAQAMISGEKPRPPLAAFLDKLPVISLVLALLVVLFVALRRRRWFAAVTAVCCMCGANATTQFLKNVVFDRPDLGLETLSFNSLPSGHTTIAASAVGAMFIVAAPRWRPVVGFGSAVFAVVAGAATLINLWHRPSDIAVAYFVVAAWVLIAGLVVINHDRFTSDKLWNVWPGYGKSWPSSRLWLILTVVAGLLGALLAVILLAPSVISSQSNNQVNEYLSSTFYGGIALVVAAGFLLNALCIWIYSRASVRPSEAVRRTGRARHAG